MQQKPQWDLHILNVIKYWYTLKHQITFKTEKLYMHLGYKQNMSSSAIRQTVNVMISEVAVYRYVHSQSSPFEQHGEKMALDLIATHSLKTALGVWMLAMYIQQAYLMLTRMGCTNAHYRLSTGNASSKITCIHRILIKTFELELAGDPACV